MVAIPGLVKTAPQQRLATCKQGTLHASTWPSADHDHMLSLSNSWPWQLQEEPPSIHPSSAKAVAASPLSPLPPSVTDHGYKQQRPYSLSSRAAASSTSRSAISSIYTTSGSASRTSDSSSHGHANYTSSPAASDHHPKSPQFTSLWVDDDADDEYAPRQVLPPLDPCDHMKTLLTQLASCISSISTAYAHQQAAMHSHSRHLAATDVGAAEEGRGAMSSTKAGRIISTTDKAMVEELECLTRLHSQLALLPRRLPFKESGAAASLPDVMKEADQSADNASVQLRRYEEIIARFHDEIRRKDAVVEALKETLAKSMLRGEKLQRRVQALEAKLRTK